MKTPHVENESTLLLLEAELRASRERCRLVIEHTPAAIAMLDRDLRYLAVSRRYAEDYRLDRDDLLGRCHYDVFPEIPARWREIHARCLAGAVEQCDGEPFARADGSTDWLRWEVRPWRDARGDIGGLVFFSETLTAQKRIESDLRARERELLVAQKMEAVGRLAGGVAHDFNNLLSVILSYTEIAASELRPDHPQRGDLAEVIKAAQRAAGLTRQLLAFSRSQELRPEPIDLVEVVGGLGRMLARLIGEDIELVIAGDGSPMTRADRGQVEQVVMNLAVNARDAMPEGGRLTIATAEVTLDAARARTLDVPPGVYIELAVADTGCGMDESVRARVFEPFFTTKGVGKGTGLGLSMVYGIARQSGGAVTVESARDEGATFRVYFPRFTGPRSVPPARVPSLRPKKGSETILVVEDEAALRQVVRRVLCAAGYRVCEAANAQEALRIATVSGEDVSLILTDVVMPGMGGRELVTRLAPLCPSARAIFMSGYTDEAIERHGVLDARFLRKPFDSRTLTERVRAVLDEDDAGATQPLALSGDGHPGGTLVSVGGVLPSGDPASGGVAPHVAVEKRQSPEMQQ